MSCDYNGWNDAPEDEREWFDQHPEIWGGPEREVDNRPFRATPTVHAQPATALISTRGTDMTGRDDRGGMLLRMPPLAFNPAAETRDSG